MTFKALVAEWCQYETDSELSDQLSWLGWDGWVSVDACYRQAHKNFSK